MRFLRSFRIIFGSNFVYFFAFLHNFWEGFIVILKHISTQDGNSYVAIINGISHLLQGDIFGEFVITDKQLDGKEIPFCNPSKIVALGLNYHKHAEEFGSKPAVEPIIFLKPTTSIVANGEPIVLPSCAEHVEFEGEIAVVVKSTCKCVSVADAPKHILGYTIANDVTERVLQKRDGQWTRAKGFDTFCPLGGVLQTELDLSNTLLTTCVNGVEKQRGNSGEMINNVYQALSFVSGVMTLNPGDVILTGTPQGCAKIVSGDVITITVQNIGSLTNPVK